VRLLLSLQAAPELLATAAALLGDVLGAVGPNALSLEGGAELGELLLQGHEVRLALQHVLTVRVLHALQLAQQLLAAPAPLLRIAVGAVGPRGLGLEAATEPGDLALARGKPFRELLRLLAAPAPLFGGALGLLGPPRLRLERATQPRNLPLGRREALVGLPQLVDGGRKLRDLALARDQALPRVVQLLARLRRLPVARGGPGLRALQRGLQLRGPAVPGEELLAPLHQLRLGLLQPAARGLVPALLRLEHGLAFGELALEPRDADLRVQPPAALALQLRPRRVELRLQAHGLAPQLAAPQALGLRVGVEALDGEAAAQEHGVAVPGRERGVLRTVAGHALADERQAARRACEARGADPRGRGALPLR